MKDACLQTATPDPRYERQCLYRRQVMNLAAVRIITDDVEKLASFYEWD